MSDITVVTGTYGDDYWDSMARTHAGPTVPEGTPWVHVHLPDGQLHEARNAALAQVRTDYVIHLDADDCLAPDYVEAMLAAEGEAWGGAGGRLLSLFTPMVRYVKAGSATRAPRFLTVAGHQRHDCTEECLREGNWLIVGTMAPTELLRDVGGWRDFPWSEDWDVWIRCWQAGASIVRVPEAVYSAWWRPDSRNRGPERAAKLEAHRAIYEANFPEGAPA